MTNGNLHRRVRDMEVIWSAAGSVDDEATFLAAELGMLPSYLKEEAARLGERYPGGTRAVAAGLAAELGCTAAELEADAEAGRRRYLAVRGAR